MRPGDVLLAHPPQADGRSKDRPVRLSSRQSPPVPGLPVAGCREDSACGTKSAPVPDLALVRKADVPQQRERVGRGRHAGAEDEIEGHPGTIGMPRFPEMEGLRR